MQRIERYGVIALVFLLVTILAVSLWGESKGDGFFSMFKSGPKKGANASVERPIRNRPAGQPVGEQSPGDRMLPLTTGDAAAPGVGGAQPMATPETLAQQPNAAGAQPNATPQGVVADPYAALRGPNAPLGAAPTTPGAQPVQPNAMNPALNPTPGSAVVRSNLPAAPAQPATREYKVKSGDTLGGIAAHELGSSARWVDIQRLNKMIEPSKLQVGMTLQLPVEHSSSVASNATTGAPAKSEPKSGATNPPKASGARKYTVQSGDTLGAIATHELGSSSRWTEIRDLNPGIDVDHLRVGATLALPGGAAATTPKGSKDVASLTPNAQKSKVK